VLLQVIGVPADEKELKKLVTERHKPAGKRKLNGMVGKAPQRQAARANG
jgi:hypothetical protein